jgi:hypothetical protein
MSEQTLRRNWVIRPVAVILTFFIVAGALAFAFS